MDKDAIISLVDKHERWRGQDCINLIPSENVMSPTARSLLSSDLGQRYTAREGFYMGTRFTDEVEQYGEKLAREVFHSQTADLRPLSGHVADLIFLGCFARPKDTFLCVLEDDGGYPGIQKQGAPSFLQLRVVSFPFSKERMNIDVNQASDLILKVKPKVVVFGASRILFPHPVKELAKLAREVGAHVGFDGSHVLGLIAGEQFQDPLREGASVLFGSTHKSFFGPQGGIILADKEHGEVIKSRIFPEFVDNAHWNRIAALALALAEMKKFGKAYAEQVVRNAQTLAKALFDVGFPVACPELGFTRSHQVFLDYGSVTRGRKVARRLEKANVIVDCGVRVGVCEATRRGMKENEMRKIAEFMKRVVIDDESQRKVKSDVVKFMAEFQKVVYCFE
jgi:glycine hydroxymethyltransferase